MSSDNKEESCSVKPDTKVEEDTSKEESQAAGQSSMDSKTKKNGKEDVKKEESVKKEIMKEDSENEGSVKEENLEDSDKEDSDKEGSDKEDSDKEDSDKEDSDKERNGKENEKDDSEKEEESEDEDEEKEIGLLDRPVEVSGCRARKQVQRLEVSFNTPSKGIQIPAGKGQKLGEIPSIEHQISKYPLYDLKPLHRVLYSKPGSANEIKKNIRKFSGFAFAKGSRDFGAKKTSMEKFTSKILKSLCDILVLEKSGTKDELIERIMEFLVCPSNSGKKAPKKKATQKKTKKNGKKSKPKAADDASDNDDDEIVANDSDESAPQSEEDDDESDSKTKKKSKAKRKKNTKVKITAVKFGNPKTQPEKGTKRKKDDEESDDDDEEPAAKKSTGTAAKKSTGPAEPEDDEIVTLVKKILEKADLQEITMKKVIRQVYDTYPECDLAHKKAFIKKTIKSVISS